MKGNAFELRPIFQSPRGLVLPEFIDFLGLRRDTIYSNRSNLYVGCKEIQIRDESTDILFNVLVQYPTIEPTSQ